MMSARTLHGVRSVQERERIQHLQGKWGAVCVSVLRCSDALTPAEAAMTSHNRSGAVSDYTVRSLVALNLVLLAIVATLLLTGFAPARQQLARELTIERLNIVDSAGRPVLILANG